ncbi:hypothetical protein pb186bvf_018870 [Paramecium bursaria]
MQARSDNVIDDGLQLLQALLESATEQLVSVQQKDDNALSHLHQKVDEAQAELHDAQGECFAISDDFALMQNQYATHKDDIQYAEDRIASIHKRIETLEYIRCASNKEWLNFIKSNKYILSLIEFLRVGIQNYNSYVELERIQPLLMMIQQEAGTEDSDIVQNLTKINQSKQSIAGLKQDLLNVLDQIEASIKQKGNTSQTDEIITTSRVGDFIVQLAKEVEYYHEELGRINSLFGEDPEAALAEKQKEIAECEVGLDVYITQAKEAQAAVDAKINHTDDVEAKLKTQAEIIKQIVDEYKLGFGSIADKYKLRIADYVEGSDNKAVDFDSRQLLDNYGDKSNIEEYVDKVLNGQAEVVSAVPKQPEALDGPEIVNSESSEDLESSSEEEYDSLTEESDAGVPVEEASSEVPWE